MNAYRPLRVTDPEGARYIAHEIAALAAEPRPEGSSGLGETNFRRLRLSASAAREILNGTAADPRHEFWPDDIPYTDVPTHGIIGHRQVTDAYLAQLARAHGSRLATLDQAMATLHPDVAELVPDS
jgi:predicted nucleic acid-binding protein